MPTKPQQPKENRSTERENQPQGKPTIDPNNHDENIGQRDHSRVKQDGAKPAVDDDRGKNYGQREGSTITEDNDVE
jgi:hypothetical protein